MQDNLIDKDWKLQPAIPTNPIITHGLKYSGKSVTDKLIDMRSFMKSNSVNAFILTTLDEVACKIDTLIVYMKGCLI